MKILKRKSNFNENVLDLNRIPEHIAFIMDGNGRWAKKRGLPRFKGHEEGARRIIDLVSSAEKFGIKAVTLYAFSTENWKRPKEEVDYIFSLLKKALIDRREKILEKNIKVCFIGKINELEKSVKDTMLEIMEITENNNGVILNLAINYGGKSEIVEAVKNIAKDCLLNNKDINDINEECIENHLMTKDLPKIDLMVRTSGEVRLSNFLLWQLAYSELVFIETYWPDFDEKELEKVLIEFQSRDRRFGGLK